MSLPLDTYTLTYRESDGGWPSFYSYAPEMIRGMNQYLYTFSGGNMWRHGVNEVRNQFYEQDSVPTTITTVINNDSLATKVFKTISLESSDAWRVTLESDIQQARDIDMEWFKKKEGDWFAFVRGESTNDNFNMRSAKGLGVPVTLSGPPSATVVTYNFRITSPIQVGDTVYATPTPATVAPVLSGNVTSVTVGATSSITIDTTVTGATTPLATDFIFYVRNQIAESQGLLGHYAVVTLENTLTTATEIMAIKADVMNSYP